MGIDAYSALLAVEMGSLGVAKWFKPGGEWRMASYMALYWDTERGWFISAEDNCYISREAAREIIKGLPKPGQSPSPGESK